MGSLIDINYDKIISYQQKYINSEVRIKSFGIEGFSGIQKVNGHDVVGIEKEPTFKGCFLTGRSLCMPWTVYITA